MLTLIKNKKLRKKLYKPWASLVFTPFFAGSTLFLGIVAVGIAQFDKNVAFHCGTFWAWCLCRANFTKVTLKGRKNADPKQSYIIMSNHQSHFDILAFYGHWGRQFRWVMKEELRKIPGLGWGCESVGHIFIDRSNSKKAIESLNKAREKLAPGTSIMFFPEGARSLDGRLKKSFKKGGFIMAQQMGLPILPVSISGANKVLPAKTRQLMPGTIRIVIHEPIDTSQYSEEDREQLMQDVRVAIASGLEPHEL